MKYLNDKLYFPVSELTSTLYTDVPYTMIVSDSQGNTMNSYSGNIFYYDADQVIYYGFLFEHLNVPLPTEEDEYPNITNIIPIVTLTVEVNNVQVLQEEICLKDEPMNDYCDIYFSNEVDKPQVINGMLYPLVIIADEKELQGVEQLDIDGEELIDITNSMVVTVEVHDFIHGQIIKKDSESKEIFIESTNMCTDKMLIWYDNRGFYQSQPFYSVENHKYTHNNITNLTETTRKYNTEEVISYNLTSDWVHNQLTYQSLFTSKYVYLYDIPTDTYTKVIINDTDYNENKSRKAFRFNLSVKQDTKKIIR